MGAELLMAACCCSAFVFDGFAYSYPCAEDGGWSEDTDATPAEANYNEAFADLGNQDVYYLAIGMEDCGYNWWDTLTAPGQWWHFVNAWGAEGLIDTSTMASATAATLTVAVAETGADNWGGTFKVDVYVDTIPFWNGVDLSDLQAAAAQGTKIGTITVTAGSGSGEFAVPPGEINLAGNTYFLFAPDMTTDPGFPGVDKQYHLEVRFTCSLEVRGTPD